jgi:hypothetical protein
MELQAKLLFSKECRLLGYEAVSLVAADVSQEPIASITRMKRMSEHQLLVGANVVPNSLILSTIMIKAMRSSETSVL